MSFLCSILCLPVVVLSACSSASVLAHTSSSWGHSTAYDESSSSRTSMGFSKSLVVSYYNERLPFAPFLGRRIQRPLHDEHETTTTFFYFKGSYAPRQVVVSNSEHSVQVQRLANVGRCDHTFLHHIVKHYDNLTDCLTFVKASELERFTRRRRLGSCRPKSTKLWFPVPDVWCGRYQRDSPKVRENTRKEQCELDLTPGVDLDNLDSKETFEAFTAKALGFSQRVNDFALGGKFHTTRRAIHCYSRRFWNALKSALDRSGPNPKLGHVMERWWGHLLLRCRRYNVTATEHFLLPLTHM